MAPESVSSSPSLLSYLAEVPEGRASPRSLALDELDIQILRHLLLGETGLFRSGRLTLDAVADRVGVHRNTVALRIRRMAAAQAFLPLTVTVDPQQVGLLRGVLWVRPPRELRSEDLLHALWLVEGLQVVVQYLEGWLIFLYGEDEATLEGRAALVRHLALDAKAPWEVRSWLDYAKRPPVRLDTVDLGILRLMLEDARRPLPVMARLLSLSPRTVERHVERLTSTGTLMVLPSHVERVSGQVFAHLRVRLTPADGPRATILRALDAQLTTAVFRNLQHPRFASWIVAVPTIADLEPLISHLKATRGVAGVDLRLFLAFRLNPRWGEWLLRVLERGARSTGPRP